MHGGSTTGSKTSGYAWDDMPEDRKVRILSRSILFCFGRHPKYANEKLTFLKRQDTVSRESRNMSTTSLSAWHTKSKSKVEGQDLKRRKNSPGGGDFKAQAIGWSLRYEKDVERLNSRAVVARESEKKWRWRKSWAGDFTEAENTTVHHGMNRLCCKFESCLAD